MVVVNVHNTLVVRNVSLKGWLISFSWFNFHTFILWFGYWIPSHIVPACTPIL